MNLEVERVLGLEEEVGGWGSLLMLLRFERGGGVGSLGGLMLVSESQLSIQTSSTGLERD